MNISIPSADVVVVPVPWDVTTSYFDGTSRGPNAVLKASAQLDLYHPAFETFPEYGAAMLPIDKTIADKSKFLREKSQRIIQKAEKGIDIFSDEALLKDLEDVNAGSRELNAWVQDQINPLIDEEQMVALLGGEHGCGFGFVEALDERLMEPFGVLQFDAHMDLRESYQGFEHSHASAMYNLLTLPKVQRLVQVGIRDVSMVEHQFVKQSKGRVSMFTARDIYHQLYAGKTWQSICKKIVNQLPEMVFISFDIDGLTPELCPNTGTPVPGGLSYWQVDFLLNELLRTNKKIIGVELVEVAPGQYDHEFNANVGARMLYLLCGYMWQSWQQD